jgi:hypothetical protein
VAILTQQLYLAKLSQRILSYLGEEMIVVVAVLFRWIRLPLQSISKKGEVAIL